MPAWLTILFIGAAAVATWFVIYLLGELCGTNKKPAPRSSNRGRGCWALILMLGLCLGMSACGGKGSVASDPPPSDPPSNPDPPPVDPPPTSNVVQIGYLTCGFTQSINCLPSGGGPNQGAAVQANISDAGATLVGPNGSLLGASSNNLCLAKNVQAGDNVTISVITTVNPSYNALANVNFQQPMASWSNGDFTINNQLVNGGSGVYDPYVPQTSASEPWIPTAVTVSNLPAGQACFQFLFPDGLPSSPPTIAQVAFLAVEYKNMSGGLDAASINLSWDPAYSGNAISNPTATAFANETLVTFAMANGGSLQAGTGELSDFTLTVGGTSFLLEEAPAATVGAYSPEVFDNQSPAQSFVLSAGFLN